MLALIVSKFSMCLKQCAYFVQRFTVSSLSWILLCNDWKNRTNENRYGNGVEKQFEWDARMFEWLGEYGNDVEMQFEWDGRMFEWLDE